MDLDLNTIVHRQKLFSSTLKSYFLRKVTKYQNVLLKNGISLSDQNYSCDDALAITRSQSFEDHVELVIGQKSASPNVCKAFWKIGNRISTIKLFRWIYLIVQRTKAARILHHLDGTSDEEIETVIKSVGQELAVAFEYQICLLEGDLEIIKLAQHAGACIITYLNCKEAHYAPENLLQAILEVKPKSNNNKEILKTRTICFSNQPVCLRWRLSQVLKQPGLRTIQCDFDEVDSEKPSLEKDNKLSDNDGENADEKLLCAPHQTTDIKQTINIGQNKNGEELKGELEDLTTTDNTENENCEGESDNTLDTDSPHEGENLIIAADSMKTRKHRRISAVDMDFEKGVIKVTDYSVEASDFSPVGYDTSQFEDSDSTSIDEDLDSEDNQVGTNLLDTSSKINTSANSQQENVKPIVKDGENNQRDLESVGTEEGTEKNQKNGEQINKTCEKLNEIACNKDVEVDNILNTDTGNSYDENNSNNKMLNEDSNVSTVNISCDSVDIPRNITDTSGNLVVPQTLHIIQSTSAQQTSKPSRDLHYQDEAHASENDQHIIGSDHINDNTYQSNQEPSDIADETIVTNCDESMPEFARSDKSYIFHGCFTPFGAKCRPKIYGYRGPLHIWNEVERRYTLIYNDTVTVMRRHQQQITECSQDFHQMYIPKTVCRH